MNFAYSIKMPLLITTILALVMMGPVSSWLEKSLLTHILIQLPLLVFSGALISYFMNTHISSRLNRINAGGIFGLITISFIVAYWMIPRNLDHALTYEAINATKYISLFIVGVLLHQSWRIAHPITRGVVLIEFLSMLFRLGWLYMISPVRLCNNYTLSEQIILGNAFLIIGITLGLTWLAPVFFGQAASRYSTIRNP